MPPGSTSVQLFGDVLARARQSWVREMALRLERGGFNDYRASDALALRWLSPGALPFSTFTRGLDVSRQSARKVVDGLIERGFATIHSDRVDARRRIVELTPRGHEYAVAVIGALHDLNDELSEKVDHAQLDASMSVLNYIKDNFGN